MRVKPRVRPRHHPGRVVLVEERQPHEPAEHGAAKRLGQARRVVDRPRDERAMGPEATAGDEAMEERMPVGELACATWGLPPSAPSRGPVAGTAGIRSFPILLRHRTITRPNQVWGMDITYIPMAHGFVYLAAGLDWASRRVLNWRVSITLDSAFCFAAVEEALARYGRCSGSCLPSGL